MTTEATRAPARLWADLLQERARNAELVAGMQCAHQQAQQHINAVTSDRDRLAATVQRVTSVPVHCGDDGREFVFADDLSAALNPRETA